MARVLCGVDQAGVQHEEPNVANDLRELDVGRWINLPDSNGELQPVRLRVWVIMSSCDHLGRQSIRPFTESPMAHVPCGGCDYDSRSPLAGRPFSFLHRPSPEPGTSKSPSNQCFRERDWPTLLTQLEQLRSGKMSDAAKKQLAHDLGISLNSLYFALDPAYIPHINPITITPEDILHLFPDGLLRSELAWLIYIFCNMHGGNDFIDRLNKATRRYPKFPADVRIPTQPDKLKKGVAGKVPDSSSTVRMTGSQCMHFTMHR